jgi:hypothetical protein
VTSHANLTTFAVPIDTRSRSTIPQPTRTRAIQRTPQPTARNEMPVSQNPMTEHMRLLGEDQARSNAPPSYPAPSVPQVQSPYQVTYYPPAPGSHQPPAQPPAIARPVANAETPGGPPHQCASLPCVQRDASPLVHLRPSVHDGVFVSAWNAPQWESACPLQLQQRVTCVLCHLPCVVSGSLRVCAFLLVHALLLVLR